MVPHKKLRSYNYHIIWNSLEIMFIMLFYGGSVMMQPKWIISILHFYIGGTQLIYRNAGAVIHSMTHHTLREFCGDEHTNYIRINMIMLFEYLCRGDVVNDEDKQFWTFLGISLYSKLSIGIKQHFEILGNIQIIVVKIL